jgi:putative transposase
MRFGYRRLIAMLLRKGVEVKHKRVYRLYREEGLAMRIRQRRRIRWNGTAANLAAVRPSQRTACITGAAFMKCNSSDLI